MTTIKVGSRESKLAVIQSELVIADIKNKYPEAVTELVTMKTTGDKILDRTLDKVGGKGLFVKELDAALMDGRADITVHSLKDMPMEISDELPIIAYSKRENPYDVLVLPKGATELDFSKPVGCASSRRTLQFNELYPEAEIKPVRGNVLTRLNKLDSGEYSALILAAAGLERLGLLDRASRTFTADEILPAAGQGIIAVQCKRGGGFEYLSEISDKTAGICAVAERACITRLGGGCSSPAAAFCVIEGDELYLRGMNVVDGKLIKAELRADIRDAERAGITLAERLM
jgi:hydroxymethylbilane synthase